MQCEKLNCSSHGGAGARETAYKVACAVTIRKFNTKEVGKPEEKKCKNINKDKENTDQKSDDFLELKNGKNIQVLNGACLEENSDNQMPTSNKSVKNKPVTVLRDIDCSGVVMKKDLINEEQLTGKIGYVMTVARTLERHLLRMWK